MKERSLVARRWVVLGVLGALIGVLLVVWAKEPDLKRLPVRELAGLARDSGEPQDWLDDPLELRAFRELKKRPRAELDVLVPALVTDPLAKRRMLAASLLGAMLHDTQMPLAVTAQQECEARLIALLDDLDEGVREAALWQLALWSRGDPEREVPASAIAVLRGFLTATTDRPRFHMVVSVIHLGPRAAVVVPELLAALGREADGGARYVLVCAIGKTRTQDPAAIEALIRGLDDPEQQGRLAAAANLCDLGPAARIAVPRLRAIFARVDEEKDVRSAAASALAQLVVTAADAEAVLGELLVRRRIYATDRACKWIEDVGSLARVVPDRQVATDANQVLTEVAEGGDKDLAMFATCELLRLAVARGDPSLPAEQLAKLATELARITGYMEGEGPFVLCGTAESVLAAFADVSRHPQGNLDRAAVVAALDNVASRGEVAERGWAKKQKAKLR